MQPTAYLFFNGNCADAIETYADIFGGEIEMRMPASEMPSEHPVPEDRKNWVMHSQIKIGDGYLMASDSIYEDMPAMAGSSVMVSLPKLDDAKRVFDRLADGGTVTMAFEPTFWSKGFGAVHDRFGVRWMVGCDEEPDPAPGA